MPVELVELRSRVTTRWKVKSVSGSKGMNMILFINNIKYCTT